jgi:hypothetical protein
LPSFHSPLAVWWVCRSLHHIAEWSQPYYREERGSYSASLWGIDGGSRGRTGWGRISNFEAIIYIAWWTRSVGKSGLVCFLIGTEKSSFCRWDCPSERMRIFWTFWTRYTFAIIDIFEEMSQWKCLLQRWISNPVNVFEEFIILPFQSKVMNSVIKSMWKTDYRQHMKIIDKNWLKVKIWKALLKSGLLHFTLFAEYNERSDVFRSSSNDKRFGQNSLA